MKDEVLSIIYRDLGVESVEYKKSISDKFDNFFEYTQLPLVYKTDGIQTDKLCPKSKKLYEGIEKIIDNRYSIAVQLDSYKDSGFICAMLLNKYFYNKIVNDDHLVNILYVDTNLLMKDYKKLIERNSENTEVNLTHSVETLQIYIENADFVFWDKFTMVQTNYELSKLYDILSVRYRSCLGNMFFTNRPLNTMSDTLSVEMLNVMNVSVVLGLDKETFKYKGEDVLQL